ncbi:hypothetical protein H6P81_001275 [Aristolochia fimbriata]|uniref:Peptidase A1 domain-containing protein n=1 Tax=Aristolochia fimbriata TaxID=158543 RepID=A0AAV7FAF8_ARIFI|nr:hypothetical protein H6P81_001275 [Aristolochia fimbriata]
MGSIFSIFRCLLLFHMILLSASVAIIHTPEADETSFDSTDDHEGFSVELIRSDSPRSPFYNPSATLADRASKAIRRSLSRLNYFKTLVQYSRSSTHDPASYPSSPPDFVSTVLPEMIDEAYLMTIHVGTPPVKRIVIADTGSGLNWIQCKPCKVCFKQDYPLFDPRKSSTYRVLNCDTRLCDALPDSFKLCGGKTQCRFNYSYGDKSVTEGELAAETFTFETTTKTTVRIPNVGFGCGHNNQGLFQSSETGLVGLNVDKTSLVRQIGPLVGWRFSHCFVPHTLPNVSSVLSFGKAARVTERGAVTLPYFYEKLANLYAVNLLEISIGKYRIRFAREERDVVLDSGTHVAILPTRIVQEMVNAVVAIIGGRKNVKDPTDTYVLCYPRSIHYKFPSMKFGFLGGDVAVRPSNVFEKVSHNVTCLAVVTDDGGVNILGNLFMGNYKYGYDLKRSTVTIAPTDCAKHSA